MGRLLTWTPVDDDLIRQLYPSGGAEACLKVIPNKNYEQVRYRAHRLGVISDYGKTMKKRMQNKHGGSYPWEPISNLDRLGFTHWGYVTMSGQLRPII